jgi:hypothetical protein
MAGSAYGPHWSLNPVTVQAYALSLPVPVGAEVGVVAVGVGVGIVEAGVVGV